MARYHTYFPNIGIPYLGRPAGRALQKSDLLDLPENAEIISISKKTKHVDQLCRFRQARTVYCVGFQPEWIEQLEQLPKLRHLQMTLRGIESVPSFQGLKNLRVLVTTYGTKVDWRFLKNVTWLHSLCIGDVKTELPLKHVGGITDLRELYIDSGARISSLNPLKKLMRLQFLMLFNKVVRNEPSIRPLAALKELTRLQLSPRYEVQDFDYLIDRLPKVDSIKLNAGLSWPPQDVPAEQRQTRGRVKTRVKSEGNKLSVEHDA